VETAAAATGGVTTFIPYLMATEPFEQIFEDVRKVTEAGARIAKLTEVVRGTD